MKYYKEGRHHIFEFGEFSITRIKLKQSQYEELANYFKQQQSTPPAEEEYSKDNEIHDLKAIIESLENKLAKFAPTEDHYVHKLANGIEKDWNELAHPKLTVTDEEIEREANIRMRKTRLKPNPPTTERELELGELAFINGAKWLRDTQPKSERERLIDLVKLARKGSMVTSPFSHQENWKFDIDRFSDVVDQYLNRKKE